MAQHPFLKSIRPVNLLSFGPKTEEIELRPLNILIGANGSGKSNLIEIVGLLSKLPDKDPWTDVIQTGGAREWIWKGEERGLTPTSIFVKVDGQAYPIDKATASLARASDFVQKTLLYSVTLQERESTFEIATERFEALDRWENDAIQVPWIERNGWTCQTLGVPMPQNGPGTLSNLSPQRSFLSALGTKNIVGPVHGIEDFAGKLERISLYKDWAFGSQSAIRDIQPAGLDSYRLAGDSNNMAQVLKALRDRGEQAVFDRLVELLRKFYEPVKDVDTELLGTHLRIMIKEDGLVSRTPASRLSDGTLRWLMLLIILLDPAPPPVICIDEPELGLHPDMLPTLADLLVDASTRTQLVVTTHSDSLLDAFTDMPEVVCICEKVEGVTVIRRLDEERLKIWRREYSLGKLWVSGEIGGNRW